MRTLLLCFGLFLVAATTSGQEIEHVAIATRGRVLRTADDARIGERQEAAKAELGLPEGTGHVDLLDRRGRPRASWPAHAVDMAVLARLKPGVWTLRAHVDGSYRIRRFAVIRGGRVIWAAAVAEY